MGEVQGPCWLELPLWPEEEEGVGAEPASALAQAGGDDLCVTGRPNSLLRAGGATRHLEIRADLICTFFFNFSPKHLFS